ncbi:TPA: hypothetical protein VM006_000884 [Streptococcus pyogenes]|nr:hypothetical protein [Streptococcus pyogenes]HER9128702.1 hypothetical protein [Streptococcus pyogenes]HES5548882.1 hypothetical protein [Streptococcus pyogenes]
MKTKSKCFLNLATLCLALLSTTLLMTQPVKADAVTTDVSTISGNGEGEGSEKKWWYRGYNDGYKAGEKSENREGLNRDNFNSFPEDLPSGDTENQGEYMDGYGGGYEAGWREGHRLEALLEDVLAFFTSIFYDWFGGDQ